MLIRFDSKTDERLRELTSKRTRGERLSTKEVAELDTLNARARGRGDGRLVALREYSKADAEVVELGFELGSEVGEKLPPWVMGEPVPAGVELMCA